MSPDIIGVTIVGILLFIFYVPPTWIIFRNTRFITPLRIIFSISIVPLFFILMVKNYWFVSDHIPDLVDQFNAVPDSMKSGRSATILAALLTCPLPVLGGYCWFKLLSFVNSKVSTNKDQKALDKVELAENASQAIWLGILSLSLIMSFILGSNLIEYLVKRGSQISPSQAVAAYLILPTLVIIVYVIKRIRINKERSSKATVFDKRGSDHSVGREVSTEKQNILNSPPANTDASVSTDKVQKGESWF